MLSEEQEATFIRDAAEVSAAGEHWFLFTRWQQLVPVHFDLGGTGKSEDPGVRWMYEQIYRLRREQKA